MRKRTKSSELVTKSFLKDELTLFENKVDSKLARLKGEIDENAKQYRDEILTRLDGVMGELKVIREETSIGAHQVFELQEQVDGHEKRIVRLEELQPVVKS